MDNSIFIFCSKVEGGTFTGSHFTSLKVLDLAYNVKCYTKDMFTPGAFEGLNELKVLSLTLGFTSDRNACLNR